MKKIQKRKLFLNRETVKELTLRNEVQGGRPVADTQRQCSIGTCFKMQTQCH
jgi:hypothetical protein